MLETYYSYNGKEPSVYLPPIIRTKDGAKTALWERPEEELNSYGIFIVDGPPEYNKETERLRWEDGEGWRVTPKGGEISPFPSWKLVDGYWEAPVPQPRDGKIYEWDESIKNWYAL
jgi:hypothetical protein|tara:strand:+ start:2731 stop:3078 length:348 start_codon:yes stop_codon:yes gene_type:complete